MKKRKIEKKEHYDKDVVAVVHGIVAEAERMKNAYFWSPPDNASGRRYYERIHSHPRIEWEEGGHIYSAEFSVECSCRNIYARGYYTRDGCITNLTAIRNSLKRMEAAQETETTTE